jgi:hypothetical protein
MPNRIIKESICTSDSINQLSPFHEVFFYRLLVNCDDYGRLDARPEVLASKLYPLRRSIREEQIIGALNALTSAELVDLYEVKGKPFLQIVTWAEHQSIRAKKSKYPAKDETCKHVQASEIKCNQVNANVPVIVFENRESYSSMREDDDDDLLLIAQQNNQVYDRAKECGFATDSATLDRLTDLIAKHGHQAVLDGLDQCVEYGAKSLAYHRKVVEGQVRREVKAAVKTKADYAAEYL